MSHRYGTHLPAEQREQLRKAARLEWISIGYAACTVTLVALVVGNSQAMRTAWVEDMLSVLPQLAFLIALQFTRKSRRPSHPYGYHRSMGAGHLVAGVALLTVGVILAYEAVSALLKAEHPTIGTMNLFGHTIWQGWLMMVVMAIIAAPAIVLGHLKIKAAKPMHNKLLYADASMAKADWHTNVASIVGVGGIAIGLWWLDSAAALVISAGIILDGVKNTRSATVDLLDRQANDLDGKKPHPVLAELERTVDRVAWIKESAIRARELGQVMHLEVFVVPSAEQISLRQVNQLKKALQEVDWTVYDVVITPVAELPDFADR